MIYLLAVAHDAVCRVREEQGQSLRSYPAVLEDLVAEVLVEERIAVESSQSHSLKRWWRLAVLAGWDSSCLSTLSGLDLLRSVFEKHFNRALSSCRFFRLACPFVSIRSIAVSYVNVALGFVDLELVVFRNVGSLSGKISLVADQAGGVLKKFMSTPSRGAERQVPPIIFILLKRGYGDESLLKQRTARRKRKRKYTVQSGFTSAQPSARKNTSLLCII